MTDSSLQHDFSQARKPLKPKRPAPFSLRLTQEERTKLDAARGRVPLGAFIKDRLFGDTVKPLRRANAPAVDDAKLAKLLAMLGQSRLSQNMSKIATGADLGTLPVLPETEAEIKQACYDIAVMRFMLMKALGKSAEPPS